MSKEINLTEILKKSIDNPNNRDLQTLIERYASPHDILEAMKEACIQTLELAVDNAKIRITENDLIEEGSCYSTYDDGVITARIDRKSILDTINKIK